MTGVSPAKIAPGLVGPVPAPTVAMSRTLSVAFAVNVPFGAITVAVTFTVPPIVPFAKNWPPFANTPGDTLSAENEAFVMAIVPPAVSWASTAKVSELFGTPIVTSSVVGFGVSVIDVIEVSIMLLPSPAASPLPSVVLPSVLPSVGRAHRSSMQTLPPVHSSEVVQGAPTLLPPQSQAASRRSRADAVAREEKGGALDMAPPRYRFHGVAHNRTPKATRSRPSCFAS